VHSRCIKKHEETPSEGQKLKWNRNPF